MDWNDKFHYGMFRNCYVKDVFRCKPSYLAWTMCYTSKRFKEDIVEVLNGMVQAEPPIRGFNYTLRQRYHEKFLSEGPW